MKRKSLLLVWAMFAAIIYPGSGACVMGQERAEAAEIYNRGMEYYRNGDYAEALDLFRQAAEQGLSGAQNVIGVMYANGEGVTQSYAEAARWYLKAAGQGIDVAQCNLGTLYCKGEGVMQDYAEALKWFYKAADQGNAAAQYNLGFLYEEGAGVAKNYEEAKKWYRRAVHQGYLAAEENLRRIEEKEQNSRPADIRSTQNENTATVSVPSGKGGAYYQNQYKNWERRAEANYRSLTNLGISLKNKRTNERTGNTGQGMNSGNYVLMKKNLREAQNQMRNIRQQASRDGVTIPQSTWETATVSY